MNADALTPSKYIKAADFGATMPVNPTLTIRDAVIEQVPSLKPGAREGDTEKKGALYFSDEADGRGWVMNKTNVTVLKAMFGNDTDAWIGKRVTLMAAPVKVGPKTEPGVRVKGSPDITEEIEVVVKLPKRKPEKFVLVPTGAPRSRPAGKTARQIFNECVAEAKMDPERVANAIRPIVDRYKLPDDDQESWEHLWKDIQPGGALRGAYEGGGE